MTEEPSKAVVIDTGSGWCKAGVAGEETPACCFPTVYAADPYGENKCIVGKDALEGRDKNPIFRAVERGRYLDLNGLEHIWQYCFLEQLRVDSTEHPVLTTFYPDENKQDKENLTMTFFETFSVPGYYSMSSSVLSLYASGKSTGLVLDSGEEITSVVPIVDGCSQSHCHILQNIGGRDISKYLYKLLNNSAIDEENARVIKEKRGYITQSEEEFAQLQVSSMPFELPDGTVLQVSQEPIKAIEAIFNPEKMGSTEMGIAQMISESVYKADADNRKELLSHIVLAGGNTLFKNFSNR